MAFAWRATMPSFTDAALVATGAGALLWTFLAEDTSARRRTVVGLTGFVALEAAVFMRYTDIVVLLVAVVAAAVLFEKRTSPHGRLRGGTARSLSSPGASRPSTSSSTEEPSRPATVRARSPSPRGGPTNLSHMPSYLVKAIPALVLGLAALIWMATRVVRAMSLGVDPASATGRRDAVVGLVLAAAWFGLWALYSAYTWTAQKGASARGATAVGGGGGAIHLIRFYLPAIGLIALLGAWLLMQLPKWLPALLLVVVATLGFSSFRSLTAVGAIGAPGSGGFPGGPPGQTTGSRFRPPSPASKLPKGSQLPPTGSPNGQQPGSAKPPNGFDFPKWFPADRQRMIRHPPGPGGTRMRRTEKVSRHCEHEVTAEAWRIPGYTTLRQHIFPFCLRSCRIRRRC